MHNRNFVNVVVLTAVVIMITASCCSGKPTGSQLRTFILKMLYDDVLWKDVLFERVRLDRNEPRIQTLGIDYLTIDLNDIDPLYVLHQLMKPTEYFSGSDLTLSAYIVDTAITCLTLKRTAVHMALTNRMLALESDKGKNVVRATVFTHIIPHNINILSSIEKGYIEMLNLYDSIALKVKADKFNKDQYADILKKELENLSNTIQKSCKNSDMKDYFRQLSLPTVKNNNLVDVITKNRTIAAHVDRDTIVALLKENENALLDLYEKMYMLKNLDMLIWKNLLKYPDLPANDEDFKRTTSPSYHEIMSETLQRRSYQFTAISERDVSLDSENPDIQYIHNLPMIYPTSK